MRKLITTLFALSVYVISLNAQINGSVKLGLAGYQGDVHCRSDEAIGILDELNASFGIGVHIPFSKVVGFRGEATYFRLSADETNFQDPGHAARGWNFTNNIIELAGLLDWEILGKRRYEDGYFRRTLTPVIFGGFGIGFTNTKVDWNGASSSKIDQDNVYDKNAEVVIPLGIGLKYYVSEKFAVALETGIRMPLSDYYDGVSRAGDPNDNDLFGFGGVKAYFGLGGKKDQDGDGIVDAKDECPTVAGTKKLNGCPDSDFDGIGDAEDKCPFRRGDAKHGGCPDSDKDGIADVDDKCPMFAGLAELNGCPDQDGDGVADSNDLCPDVDGGGNKVGCPDQDGDGVIDEFDECPEVAGAIFKRGCPHIDTDRDGIEDEVDECPELKGTAATKGCPDFDRDGIANKDDLCPTIKGDAQNGCPNGVVPFPESAATLIPKGQTCNCRGNENLIFNIPTYKNAKSLSRLGTNPEFGNSHGLDALGFYDKLMKAYNTSERDSKFLDDLFIGMGYANFGDASLELFSEVTLAYGVSGNIGYGKDHKTLYATLNCKSEKDLMAFRIRAANGCDMHFMKTCGNHFFMCGN